MKNGWTRGGTGVLSHWQPGVAVQAGASMRSPREQTPGSQYPALTPAGRVAGHSPALHL